MSYPSDLFRAIFTPGAPPALLMATNASFALLQVTLLVMLFVTYSYHFVFLSIICAGVWGGINWFVREVDRLKKVEQQATEIRRVQTELAKREDARTQVDEGFGDRDDEPAMTTGVQSMDEAVERRKFLEEEDDDDFEKVEKEDGYEIEGKKAK